MESGKSDLYSTGNLLYSRGDRGLERLPGNIYSDCWEKVRAGPEMREGKYLERIRVWRMENTET